MNAQRVIEGVRRNAGVILLALLASVSVTYSACSSPSRSFVDVDGGGVPGDDSTTFDSLIDDVVPGDDTTTNKDTLPGDDTHVDTNIDDVPSSGG